MDSGLWGIAPSVPWVTTLFIACILVLWAYFFFFRFTPVVVSNAPAVLTSLGILATFVGVASGLSGFDTGDVQGSIPALLDGLKTAFWSSIVGIGAAITIKLKHVVTARRTDKDEAAHESATVDDLADLLRELNGALGHGTNDRLDTLKRSLDEFLEHSAESNSRALVSALHEVIRDFNVKLNEQFGGNFTRLNEAVERILVWQDRYAKQTAEVIEQQAHAAERITTTSGSYERLAEKADAFSGMTEKLGNLLSELDGQKKQTQEATASLVDIADYCRTWNYIAPTAPSQSFDGKPSEWRKERARPAAAGVQEA